MSANDKNSNNPKTAREAQQRKEARRSNLIYGSIGVAFLLVAICVVVWKSNVIQKSAVAATINGENYSVAEVNYYYTNIYQNFLSSNGSYLSYLGLDTNSDLRSQSYPGDETQTWFDYFMEQAVSQMSSILALNDAAEKEGYVWNDTMQATYDENMEALESTATASGMTASNYIKRIYGATMTTGVYEAQLKRVILANDFAQSHNDALTYSDSDITAEYTANPNNYDRANYESIRISGSAPSTTDADGNTVDATEEEQAAAMSDAKAKADALLADFRAGQSLSDLAEADTSTYSYTNGSDASYTDSTLMNWVFDSARRGGDSAVLEDTANSAYYVVTFENRYRPDYNTVNVRHILIQPEAGTLAEDADGYAEEQEQLKADAKAKADELLAQWQSGEATEDSFAALANESSSDGGSNTNGGLYEQVYQGQMVTAFNDWCFDSARKPGDTGVVETDYGYHIMYFVGEDEPYWKVLATSTLRDADYNEWYEGVTAAFSGEPVASGAKYVG